MAGLFSHFHLALFSTALILGVVLEASRSTAAMSRMITRHHIRVQRLEEELKIYRSRQKTEGL